MSNPTLDSDPSQPRLTLDEPAAEKRLHPRRALPVRCWIVDARHTLYLRVHDISRGGLSVRAMVPFTPLERIELGLELPGGQRVRALGEVVWVLEPNGETHGPRMGARFLEFVEGEDDLAQLLGNA